MPEGLLYLPWKSSLIALKNTRNICLIAFEILRSVLKILTKTMKICLIYLVKYPKYLLDIPCQLLLFKDLVHLSYEMSESLLDLLPTIEIFFNYIDKDLKDLLDTV